MITKNNKGIMYVVVGFILVLIYMLIRFLKEKSFIDFIYLSITIMFLFRYLKIKKYN